MRHFFVKDGKNFPVACVATEESADRQSIAYALSICNPLDYQNFDAERARAIAQARLKKYLDGDYDKYQRQPLYSEEIPKAQVKAREQERRFIVAKANSIVNPPGKNPKLHVLHTLAKHNDLPRYFRAAATFRAAVLEARMKARQAQKEGADAAVKSA
jgi:hypothetical protein